MAKSLAAEKAEGENDTAKGELAVIAGDIALAFMQYGDGNLSAVLDALIVLHQALEKFGVAAATQLFGKNSRQVGLMKELLNIVNGAIPVVTFAATMQLGFYAVAPLLATIMMGPHTPAQLMEMAISPVIGVVGVAAVAVGQQLITQGGKEEKQAGTIESDNIFDWCTSTPGACSPTVRWNLH